MKMFENLGKKFDYWIVNSHLKTARAAKKIDGKNPGVYVDFQEETKIWAEVSQCLNDLGQFEMHCEDGRIRQVRTIGRLDTNSMLSYSSKANDTQTIESYRLDRVLKVKPISSN